MGSASRIAVRVMLGENRIFTGYDRAIELFLQAKLMLADPIRNGWTS
jgi:hypothetical protein